ncbi:hypothetical protein GCM10022224_022300 [Nonomuraea antimicrobica]|uniref:DUF11 domain-containing protein n=2 Tax=Nonomuraea antimicrobica TaxID=561173 RepID=A0ABP7BHL5_9ACTN
MLTTLAGVTLALPAAADRPPAPAQAQADLHPATSLTSGRGTPLWAGHETHLRAGRETSFRAGDGTPFRAGRGTPLNAGHGTPLKADPPADGRAAAVAAAGDRRWGAEASPLMRPGRAVRYWTPGKQARARAAELPVSGTTTGTTTGGTSGTAPGTPAGTAVGSRTGATTGTTIGTKIGTRIGGVATSAVRDATPRSATSTPRKFATSGAERTAVLRSVPSAKRLTPGADANGYAGVRRPYTATPFSRISGRLFFVNAGGTGDSCSASVVRSAAGLLIVTAAHCVYGVPEGTVTGRWHTNFAFVPAYDGRAENVRQREPYGRWGGRRAWKPDGYTGMSGGDWNSIYDIALIEVGRRKRTLQDEVGAFTPMLNQGGRHTIATTGYPGLLGRKPYDGRDQLWCLARTRQAEGVSEPETMLAARHAALPATTGRLETYNCHLYKGHSGGAWIIRGTGDLVGVLSAGTEDGASDGNSVANALNLEGYGAIVKKADPRGVYDALSVKLARPRQTSGRGRSATVTATVTMRGLMAAAQVPVTLKVPPGVRLNSVSGATCRIDGREAACTIGAVRPGRPVRLTARTYVERNSGRNLPITARVTSTRLDPTQRDNTDELRLSARG